MVGVNMTYRLAPQHGGPAAQQDIGAAMAWLRQNIAAHGGDPGRIVLVGHSAGAALPGLLTSTVPMLPAYAELDPPECVARLRHKRVSGAGEYPCAA